MQNFNLWLFKISRCCMCRCTNLWMLTILRICNVHTFKSFDFKEFKCLENIFCFTSLQADSRIFIIILVLIYFNIHKHIINFSDEIIIEQALVEPKLFIFIMNNLLDFLRNSLNLFIFTCFCDTL